MRVCAALAAGMLLSGTAGAATDWRVPAPGRLIDLSVAGRRSESASASKANHWLVKLSGPITAAFCAALERGGVTVETPLSADSAVVRTDGRSPLGNAAVVWAAPLGIDDKAPASLLESAGPLPAVSVLGHPGTKASDLLAAAARSGLPLWGGYDSPSGGRAEIAPGGSATALRALLSGDLVLAALPRAVPVLANDRSVGTIQSGVPLGPTPFFDRGIFGRDEIVGILDTGLDVDSCYFSDPTHAFPINGWTAAAGYGTVAGSDHRKIAAYDFLHPCGLFAAPCDDPSNPADYDDEGHGTHVAGNAAGDNGAHPLLHDPEDGMAPGARLVVQDGGFSLNDPCGDLPGLGCARGGVLTLLDQAYQQGARIHNDSWADGPVGPAPANSGYSMDAHDVDAFVFAHPDFLPFFVAGNQGASGSGSIPSPCSAKDVVCVGSTRNTPTGSDEDLSDFSGLGPTSDGRIKPDVVAPGVNVSASSDFSIDSFNCSTAAGAGTSYATPTAAGAAALVRDYFDHGYYPDGTENLARGFSPSAALVKACLIGSGDALAGARLGVPVDPPPSNAQGFGRIDLSKVLPLPGSLFGLFVADRLAGFAPGETAPVVFSVRVVSSSQPLRVSLVWTDPPGVPRAYPDPTPELVDDLDLVLLAPDAAATLGAGGPVSGGSDHLNNVERAEIAAPAPGLWRIEVVPTNVPVGPAVGFAIVVTGAIDAEGEPSLGFGSDTPALSADPNGDGRVGNCEHLASSIRILNQDGLVAGGPLLTIEPLDSAIVLETPMPISVPPILPGGAVDIPFEFSAGTNGVPLACGETIPMEATLLLPDGTTLTRTFAFQAPDAPPGCGDVGSLTCGPEHVRPFRPR